MIGQETRFEVVMYGRAILSASHPDLRNSPNLVSGPDGRSTGSERSSWHLNPPKSMKDAHFPLKDESALA